MHNQTCLAADPLHAQAAEILGQAEHLEELIEGAAAWHVDEGTGLKPERP